MPSRLPTVDDLPTSHARRPDAKSPVATNESFPVWPSAAEQCASFFRRGRTSASIDAADPQSLPFLFSPSSVLHPMIAPFGTLTCGGPAGAALDAAGGAAAPLTI